MKKEEDFDALLAGGDLQHSHKSSWFKRIKKGILTSNSYKK